MITIPSSPVTPIVDRQLENRSKLIFSFKKSTGGGTHPPKTLHFAENIDVKESTRANYSEYTPLGNNGSVFAYLGSQSREISLNFSITLQNIMMHTLIKPPTQKAASKITKESYSLVKKTLKGDVVVPPSNDKKLVEKFINSFITNIKSDPNDVSLYAAISEAGSTKAIESFYKDDIFSNTRLTAIMKVMFWINLIRCSVMTNSLRPSLGPPIITLVHGILYDHVPCIATDYSISYDEQAGFDETTLLPRRLKVSLKLREVRLRGDSFNPNNQETKHMMPGYESFIENGFGTLDPTNSAFNTKDIGSK